jgi:transaldolase
LLGILDGVTTNPTLIRQAVEDLKKKGNNIEMEAYIKQILKTARGTPVSLEVIGNTYQEMIEEGKRIFKKFNSVAGNVYIKIPVNPSFGEKTENTFDGIKAIKELSRLKIPVNCTLVFTPEQALMAAKAGAKFVSPFAGRVDDYIRSQNDISFKKSDYFPAAGLEKNNNVLEDNGVVSGVDLVSQIAEIFENYVIESEIIAASIRNPRQVREVALAGADIATLPFSVIEKTLIHYKTMEGMEKFTLDVVSEYKDLIKGS